MKIKTAVSALAMSLILIMTGCSGESVTFARGKYDTSAKKYTSETFGISAALDDNWEVYGDSELATVSGMKGSSNDEDFISALESNGYVFDFYAVNKDAERGTSINITIDNLKKSGNSLFSEETLAKAAIEQIKEQFEGQGAKMDKADKTTTTFAGTERHSADYKVTANGVSVFEKQIFIKKGGYLCTVTLASLSETTIKELADMFSAV